MALTNLLLFFIIYSSSGETTSKQNQAVSVIVTPSVIFHDYSSTVTFSCLFGYEIKTDYVLTWGYHNYDNNSSEEIYTYFSDNKAKTGPQGLYKDRIEDYIVNQKSHILKLKHVTWCDVGNYLCKLSTDKNDPRKYSDAEGQLDALLNRIESQNEVDDMEPSYATVTCTAYSNISESNITIESNLNRSNFTSLGYNIQKCVYKYVVSLVYNTNTQRMEETIECKSTGIAKINLKSTKKNLVWVIWILMVILALLFISLGIFLYWRRQHRPGSGFSAGNLLAPSNVIVKEHEDKVIVKWQAPGNNLSVSNISFIIQKAKRQPAPVIPSETDWIDAMETKICQYEEDFDVDRTRFYFRVAAKKGSKCSKFAYTSPTKPKNFKTVLTNKEGEQNLKLQWEPPDYNNGSAVNRYVIKRRKITGTEWFILIQYTPNPCETLYETEYTSTDKKDLDSYYYRVAAVNEGGIGEFIYVPPTPPRNLKVIYLPKFSTIKWNEPESDGGTVICDYVLQKKVAGGEDWEPSISCFQSDLKYSDYYNYHGTHYRVAAVTKDGGIGEWAYVAPSEPRHIRFQDGHLTWEAPERDLDEPPVKKYIIQTKVVGQLEWKNHGYHDVEEGSQLKYKCNVSDQCVDYRIAAVSKMGIGEYGYVMPSAPKCEKRIKGNKIELEWKKPEFVGPIRLDHYIVEKRPHGSNSWLKRDKQDFLYDIQLLLDDYSYAGDYRVAVVTENGTRGEYGYPSMQN